MPGHAGLCVFGQHGRVKREEQQQNKGGENIDMPQDLALEVKAHRNKNPVDQCQRAERQHTSAYLPTGTPDRSKDQRRDPVQ